MDGRMTGGRTIYGLQVLRGIAAVIIIACHVVPILSVGNAGVDLFFVISGFVIVWTTHEHRLKHSFWRSFLQKRIVRILPLYWITTTAKIVVILLITSLFRAAQLQPWHVVASYLLIPSRDPTGQIIPVMAGGWTLCFEMAFYYACAACLAINRRPVAYLTPAFLVLGLIGLFRTENWGAPATLIDPLLLEFVAGMWIAELTLRGALSGNPGIMKALLALGVAVFLGSALIDPAVARAWRVVAWGVPAAIIVYAAVGLERYIAFDKLRLPLLLGDASYSIYLTYPLVVNAITGPVARLVVPVAGNVGMYLVLMAAGVAGGVVVWQVVERTIIRSTFNALRSYREALMQPSQGI